MIKCCCGNELTSEPVGVIEKQIPQCDRCRKEDDRDWKVFLEGLVDLKDPLLLGLFKQSKMYTVNDKQTKIIAVFPSACGFFEETIKETAPAWMSYVRAIFSEDTVVYPLFDGDINVDY